MDSPPVPARKRKTLHEAQDATPGAEQKTFLGRWQAVTVVASKIAPLAHKIRNDAVESRTLEVQGLKDKRQREE